MILSRNLTQNRHICVYLAAILGLFWSSGIALGATGPWWQTDHGKLRLISKANSTGNAANLKLGLQFQMKPGWKIYWRSPGDAGFPPRLNWAGSSNIAKVKIYWPIPVRFSVLGLETLGYKNEVVLPLEVEIFESGKPISARAQVSYLTCEKICVPYQAKLTLDLPAGPETNSLEAAIIDQFSARVPRQAKRAAILIMSSEIDGAPGNQQLRVVASVAGSFIAPDLLVEGPPGFRFGKVRVKILETISGSGRAIFLATVLPPSQIVKQKMSANLTGMPVTLTVIDGTRAVEQTIHTSRGVATVRPVGFDQAHTTSAVSFTEFLAILGLALIGGMILNLMPCVLPVLSLKLLSVIGHGGSKLSDVRKAFLASAAGIVVSFIVLGTVAVALKSGGHAVGWGIQFQHPLFLTTTTVMVALFAANLWGLFEIRLPGMVSHAALSAENLAPDGITKHFVTGVFATLLATPCSAPFLGTAVGFALARGVFEIMSIFAMLGVGLALPYLLFAARPRMARWLPQPGRWMVILRIILGFALAGTASWLLTILNNQCGMDAALVAAGLVALLLIVLWVGRSARTNTPRYVWGTATVVALLGIVVPPQLAQKTSPLQPTVNVPVRWQPFSPNSIADLVANGRTVFVDVTADWCITCKVNKVMVLHTKRISARLNNVDIIAMQANWTRPNPQIIAFLHRFMRYGIPFNAVFGPRMPQGTVLPEILTPNAVLDALNIAASRKSTVRQ